jgi:ribonuclease E
MASPDESRVDEARDQAGTPAHPDPDPTTTADPPTDEPQPALNGGSASDRPDEPVSPGRPRGTASFAGGPPPVTAPPAEATAPSAQPVPPAEPPSFRVTTVEPTAASFPGGPPPSAPPPRPDAPPAARPDRPQPGPAGPPDGPTPPAAAQPPEAPSRTAAEAPAGPAPSVPAPTPSTHADAQGAAPPPAGADTAAPPAPHAGGGDAPTGGATAAAAAPVEAAPAVAEAEPAPPAEPAAEQPPGGTAADAADAAGGRGGRRRRRGRGARSAPAAGPATAGGPEAAVAGEAATAATAPTGAEAPAATVTRRPRRGEPDGGDAEDRPAETGESPAVAPAPTGSARTRARRRRRAAARARTREDDVEAPTDEPAAPDAATPTAAAPVSGRRGRRTAQPQEAPTATAEPDGPAAPTAAPDGPAAPAARATRTARRSGAARAAAGETGAAEQPAPPAELQPNRSGNREAAADAAAGERGSGRTRRRGRGRLAAVKEGTSSATAPADAPARPAASERSTRLETRGRAGRQGDRGRRRPRGLTEEQKRVLREEGPDKRMLVTEGPERTQIGVLEGQTLVEHYVTRKAGRSMVGNIYLGRVQNVLPGMEAAFVDIGRGRNAVLYAGEVNYNEDDLDGEAPRIEKVLKPGQPVLVQVTKDPIGAKGARLTAQVSLAGRYLVLQPEDNTFGISRRLPEDERSRLREILKEVRPKGLGLIVRTAAEGASADDLRADLARLQARWEAVERKAKKASAPAAIYAEPELVVRVIRDIFSPDFTELVVDDDELHQRVQEYLQEVAPDLLPKLRRHDGPLPLFEEYRVVEQIHKALERKVWLPSGGSIVIDRTEAMTVIDVNTGKFVGRANLEETVVANNLEAADEIVRQLRLRDIGGIIIIDFIDMLFERNQQAVVDRLRDALTRDKTKSQVMEVSSLGLVQMTRKRVSGGLLDSFSETCPTCDGRGVVITHEIR